MPRLCHDREADSRLCLGVLPFEALAEEWAVEPSQLVLMALEQLFLCLPPNIHTMHASDFHVLQVCKELSAGQIELSLRLALFVC
eukprot:2387951-Pleurochrysis_carterae.AAC.2